VHEDACVLVQIIPAVLIACIIRCLCNALFPVLQIVPGIVHACRGCDKHQKRRKKNERAYEARHMDIAACKPEKYYPSQNITQRYNIFLIYKYLLQNRQKTQKCENPL
jgi:hypothetical protein